MSDNVAKNNRFLFNILGYRNLSYKVQSASIGSINLGSTPYATRDADIFVPSNKIDFSPMAVRILVNENLDEWFEVMKWTYDMRKRNASHLETVAEGILTVLSANNRPVMEVIYHSLAPISISELDFDLNSEETTLTFDLTMVYDSYSLKNLITGELIDYSE